MKKLGYNIYDTALFTYSMEYSIDIYNGLTFPFR